MLFLSPTPIVVIQYNKCLLFQDTITPLAADSENMLASLGLSPAPNKMAKKEGSDDSIGWIRGEWDWLIIVSRDTESGDQGNRGINGY